MVVVLPAFNEGRVIQRLLREIDATLTAAGYPAHTLIVVDDGSRDDTVAQVESVLADLPVVLVRHERNEGLGHALRTGLVAAAARVDDDDVVLTTEADGTQPTDVLPRLVAAIEAGHDFVVGSPLASEEPFRGVKWYRRFLSRGANLLYERLFPIHTLEDYTVLVRGLRGGLLRRAVESYGTKGLIVRRGFEGVPELVLKLRPLLPRIHEVPITIDHTVLERKSQMPVLRTIRASLILIGIEMMARLQRRMGDL